MFVFRISACVAVMLLSISACSSEQPEQPAATPQEQAAAPAAATSQPAAASETATPAGETETAASKMTDTSKPAGETTPPPASKPAEPQMTLGPNMVRISASIVDTEEAGNSYICTLKIEQVKGTGPSTPPLARGNDIKVRIKKVVGQSDKLASKGGTVDVTMQHSPPMASIQPPPPSWNVMEVH